MKLTDAIKTLDECIPHPNNKMVDSDHFSIAVAWQTVKATLAEETLVKDDNTARERARANQIEVIRKRIDNSELTDEEKRLLEDLCFETNYDRRTI